MEYTHLKFVFIGGFTVEEVKISENLVSIDCPNQYGGIGDITIHGTCNFYSGQWFRCTEFSTLFSNLVEIYLITLSDNDKPKLLWRLPNRGFSYKWSNKYATVVCHKLKILS